MKIPLILAVGKKETQNKTVSVRRLGSTNTETVSLNNFLEKLQKETLLPIQEKLI
jgi:threonyl-tRNA synthetase